jgi:hypothetical protein
MRALIFPTYSFPGNVLTDSLYILARAVIRQRPDVHWYLVVPDWDGKFPVDDLDDLSWCTKVPTPMLTLYRTQESTTDPATIWRFGPQQGQIPVEFCISMNPQRTLNLANAWSIRQPVYERPVMVTWDLLARDDRNMEYSADEIELTHAAAGMAVSDLNMHEAPVTEWMSAYNARKYLAPALQRRVRETSRLFELGIDWERLGALPRERRQRFAVYYGGRFADSKRFDQLAETLDDMYRFGREMDIVVCTGSLSEIEKSKFVKRFPQVELHVGTSQEEAWTIQQSCHASLCFSRGELFGMSFWEQLGGGLAVVMRSAFWNEKMLPPEYPLRAETRQHAAVQIRRLYDQHRADPAGYDRAYSWDSEWARYVRGRYDPKNLSSMVDEIVSAVHRRRARSFRVWADRPESFAQVVHDGLAGVEVTTLADAMRSTRKASRIGRNFVGSRLEWGKSQSLLGLYRAMLSLGWTDDVSQPVPTLTRGAS